MKFVLSHLIKVSNWSELYFPIQSKALKIFLRSLIAQILAYNDDMRLQGRQRQ